jgi:hypothetical protein
MGEICEVTKESRLVIVNGKLIDLNSKLRNMDDTLSGLLDSLVGFEAQVEAIEPEKTKQNNGIIGELETVVADLHKTADCLQSTINKIRASGIA